MAYSVGILGASGYVGAELARLVGDHPELELKCLCAETQAGKAFSEIFPNLGPLGNFTLKSIAESKEELASCDIIFSALPNGQASNILPSLANRILVDLSGDFRLDSAHQYSTFYKFEHPCPEQLPLWTYGLPELFREKITNAKRISNPGCYATASILSLAPLVKFKLIEGTANIVGLSGTSGAGRQPKPNLHFAHAYEDVRSYRVVGHQHIPEIELMVQRFADSAVNIAFVPHLIPMSRGIQVTVLARTQAGVDRNAVMEAFARCYENEPFIDFSFAGDIGTKDVRGSNSVRIAADLDLRTGQVIVRAVIDNLVRGAAGQAVQNVNIALGIPEASGLQRVGLYP